MKFRFAFFSALFTVLAVSTFAQPGTYYNSINPSAPTFIDDLKARIRSPYTVKSYDDMKATFQEFDSRDTLDGKKVVTCVYTGYKYMYTPPITLGSTSGTINREHTWCQSWGADQTPAQSDKHHIFPTESAENSRRGNKPFGTGTGYYNITRFQHRGDAARALLYMSVRYHNSGLSGTWLIPDQGDNGYYQDLSLLLQWHRDDPPDKWEVARNNYIQGVQQNRNPFVDHPEYAKYINFANMTKLSPSFVAEPSEHLAGLSAAVSGNTVTVKWTDAGGSQLPSGYFLMVYDWDQYFIPIDGEPYTDDADLSDGSAFVNISYAGADSIQFTGLTTGKTYYVTVYSFNGDDSLRNYKIDGTVPQTNATVGSVSTQVRFASTSATVLKTAGSYNLLVSVLNPSPMQTTSVQVALFSGDTAAVGNYTTQTATFTAGSAASVSIPVTITNDTTKSGNRVLTFELQNVAGGDSAVISTPSQFTLTIEDVVLSGGDVIINEFSQGSAGAKEWVEILIASDEFSLKNYRLRDNSTPLGLDIEFAGTGFSNLSQGTLIVVYNGSDVDGTITPDLAYDGVTDKTLVISSLNNSGTYSLNRVAGWVTANTGAFGNASTTDSPRLFDPLGNVIHQMPRLPSPAAGKATAFLGNSTGKAKDAAYWSADIPSTSATPAQPNGGDNTTWILTALPVELEDFNVTALPDGAVLTWMTASETDNFGFEIQRSTDSRTWSTIAFVPGAGTTNNPRRYSYIDREKVFGFVFYRLKQVDLDSAFSYSKVFQVFRGSVPGEVYFPLNYPNPFNPSTEIRFAFGARTFVTLKVYDVRGAEVATLFNGYVDANRMYEQRFDANGLPSGIYYSRLIGGGEVRVQKMVLMK